VIFSNGTFLGDCYKFLRNLKPHEIFEKVIAPPLP
jgi:hypothetical protein